MSSIEVELPNTWRANGKIILDLGDSIFITSGTPEVLCQEIADWFAANDLKPMLTVRKPFARTRIYGREYRLTFDNETAATLFKMTWL